mmetsp:Transcript_50229/g.98469  ORF Transcript_50229/g.98469 Transcript_50229/m.98469 type:complete len:232 (-) Transcript_50229:70-765(-)
MMLSRRLSCTKKSCRVQRFFSTASARISLETKEYVDATEEERLIPRHGKGDGLVVLNVGGKEFRTLRSTLQSNRVLWDHVKRAENNGEFTKDGAVFVDRDPTHFNVILCHLRNTAEGLELKGRSLEKVFTKSKETVQLHSKDPVVLRDIYLEAEHFEIEEIRAQTCSISVLAGAARFLKGDSNPFDTVNKFIVRLRAIAIACGSAATASFGLLGELPPPLQNAITAIQGLT